MRRSHHILLAGLCALGTTSLIGLPALAHHGWSWTEQDEFFELQGVVTAVYVGNPHATIDLDVEGTIWRIELAPPAATIASGFTEGAVEVGQTITAIGNRSTDADEARMKAVRVVVGETTYDVYPDRADDI